MSEIVNNFKVKYNCKIIIRDEITSRRIISGKGTKMSIDLSPKEKKILIKKGASTSWEKIYIDWSQTPTFNLEVDITDKTNWEIKTTKLYRRLVKEKVINSTNELEIKFINKSNPPRPDLLSTVTIGDPPQ